jgi:hypothetical protein
VTYCQIEPYEFATIFYNKLTIFICVSKWDHNSPPSCRQRNHFSSHPCMREEAFDAGVLPSGDPQFALSGSSRDAECGRLKSPLAKVEKPPVGTTYLFVLEWKLQIMQQQSQQFSSPDNSSSADRRDKTSFARSNQLVKSQIRLQ